MHTHLSHVSSPIYGSTLFTYIITLTQRFGIHGIEFDMLVQEAIPEVLFLSRILML